MIAVAVTLIALLSAVLLADIVVFVRCQTFKTFTSALISVCLCFDLLSRIAQCVIVQIPSKHSQDTKDSQEAFRDSTQYLVSIVAIALFVQWLWLYMAIKHPDQVSRLSQTKATLLLSSAVTVILANDYVSLFVDINSGQIAYRITTNILFSLCMYALLTAYAVLYCGFIRLLRHPEHNLDSRKSIIHAFFLFLITMQLARVAIQTVQTILFWKYEDQIQPQLIY